MNVNRQQSQTTASYGALPVHKSNMYAGAPQATFRPVNRVHRSSGFGNPMTQQRHLPSAYTANENLQQSQNLTSHAGSSNGHYNEYGLRDEDSLTGEYIQSVASHARPSASHHNAAHSQEQSSSEEGNSDEDGGSDGDCEGEEEDESEESESEANSENDENHGNEEPDAEMSSAEADPRMSILTAEERRELERYLEQDRINTQMYGTGAISGVMLLSYMASNEGQFRSGLKRIIGEISDDDEAKEMQNQRAKRTKRRGDAAGAGSQTIPQTPNPGPWGENIRQGALVNTSRRPATRPLGSAVERLHNDRFRRPTPKATQNKVPELLYESRPDLVMGGEEYIVNCYHDQPQLPHYDSRPNTDFPQPGNGMGSSHRDTHTPTHPSEYRQLQAGSERTSLALNPTVEDSSRNTPAQAPQNPIELARNDVPTASRRTPQQPTSNTVQDDQFFSDELFNGMLNGQPDANHVGCIYTRSQQNEIDQYYQRLMDPRPGDTPDSNAENNTTPPPPQQFRREDPSTVFVADLLNPHARPQAGHGGGAPQAYIPFNIPNAPAQSVIAPLVPQVPRQAQRPTEGPEMGLNIGNIAGWDPGWSAFVNDHDGEPLLRGQYPDEYP